MSEQEPNNNLPPIPGSDSPSPQEVDPKLAFEMGAESTPPKAPALWSPPEPEVLDPLFPEYTITELIGRGGMGAVYRGMQKSLDRLVAIKVLPPELANADPNFAARFEREAKSMARLDHPNIVHVHDFGRTGAGHWFIVMEFVDGLDFHQLIRSGQLDTATALAAVSEICDALEYAHGMGFVHRDIKPDNIFINRNGKLKIGDFGLAKLIGSNATEVPGSEFNQTLTATGASMGTPAYSAPEQIDGRSTDHRADIYSLGVMFYEMLTRELPRGNFQPPSRKVNVDVRIDDVVLRAMESERERRYSSAGEMRTELDEARTTAPPLPPKNFKYQTKPKTMTTATVSQLPLPSAQPDYKAIIRGKIGLIFLILTFLTPPLCVFLFGYSENPGAVRWLSGFSMAAMFICLVFSFVFGILGWADVTGKIAAIASACFLLLGMPAVLFLTLYTNVRSELKDVRQPELIHYRD